MILNQFVTIKTLKREVSASWAAGKPKISSLESSLGVYTILHRFTLRTAWAFTLLLWMSQILVAQSDAPKQQVTVPDSVRDMITSGGIRSLSDTTEGLITPVKKDELDYWRLSAVIGTAVSTLGASYLYLQDTWWKDNDPDFRFDTGNDLHYAHNLDKAAHFYGGIIAADLSYGALRWAGMTQEQALWYGVLFGAFIQAAIETKDGYSPRWGFSLYDVGIGTLGSLYPVAQYYIPSLANIDIKFSYWQRNRKYFTDIKPDGQFIDDYINQTYWASVKVNNFLPASWQDGYPDWLAFAVGLGVDHNLSGWSDPDHPEYNQGNLELYLALDVDLTAVLPSDSPVWGAVMKYLNYIKFPAPAVRITPSVIWYGLYF
jgi:VanZ family protein